MNGDKETMDVEQQQRHRVLCESDEIENSDESSESRPSGERWAPVGANDGDNEFADEYKYINTNVDKCVLLFIISIFYTFSNNSFIFLLHKIYIIYA